MSRQLERLWVISYDIQDNSIRRQVHDLLKNHGQRVQFSVFECWLKRPAMDVLREKLREIIRENDNIRWYPLCHLCQEHTEKQGKGEPAKNLDYYLL